MLVFLRRFACEDDGATMLEYAIMLALISAALVTAVSTLSNSVGGKFTSVSTTISGS
jgi:Flp pilus assembly pilin Flp